MPFSAADQQTKCGKNILGTDFFFLKCACVIEAICALIKKKHIYIVGSRYVPIILNWHIYFFFFIKMEPIIDPTPACWVENCLTAHNDLSFFGQSTHNDLSTTSAIRIHNHLYYTFTTLSFLLDRRFIYRSISKAVVRSIIIILVIEDHHHVRTYVHISISVWMYDDDDDPTWHKTCSFQFVAFHFLKALDR